MWEKERERERIERERKEEGEQRLKSKCERGDNESPSLRFQGLPASRCAPMGKPNFTSGGDSPTLRGGCFRVVSNTRGNHQYAMHFVNLMSSDTWYYCQVTT